MFLKIENILTNKKLFTTLKVKKIYNFVQKRAQSDLKKINSYYEFAKKNIINGLILSLIIGFFAGTTYILAIKDHASYDTLLDNLSIIREDWFKEWLVTFLRSLKQEDLDELLSNVPNSNNITKTTDPINISTESIIISEEEKEAIMKAETYIALEAFWIVSFCFILKAYFKVCGEIE